MKILLATDGSEFSNVAVDSVAKRPWPEGSEMKIVSVMDFPWPPTTETWALPDGYYEKLQNASKEQAAAAIKDAVARIKSGKSSGVELTTQIACGPAKAAIMDEAKSWDADLIVLGSHGRGGWDRFLLGSVSQAVAMNAPCSVEIVRGRKSKARAEGFKEERRGVER
jgi:nucleotide-binding universal stress UspA family protein